VNQRKKDAAHFIAFLNRKVDPHREIPGKMNSPHLVYESAHAGGNLRLICGSVKHS
jgi:hypothetical protein